MGLFDRIRKIRENLDLPCPGSFESLHREAKSVLASPQYLFEGAKIELQSNLSPNFQVTHLMSFASQANPNQYIFGAVYGGARSLLQGQIDTDGSLFARAHFNWKNPPPPPLFHTIYEQAEFISRPHPQSTTKFVAQLSTDDGHSVINLEHDHVGKDYAINVKLFNPNIVDNPPNKNTSTTGIFIASFLKSITKHLTVGAEYLLQKQTPEMEESNISFVARYQGRFNEHFNRIYVFTATYQPANGVFNASYFYKLNHRLEMATELQALVNGRKEALCTAGFKLDTHYATIRGIIDSKGKIGTVLEEKLAPGFNFTVSINIDFILIIGKKNK
ncbi:hypothetical protein PIROE2DRAFT_41901 [Piromyces sp. E2]|nr:hypothetical protein PIROE2DRAFT_41901 [Piromyces sp. E2]|eukprot:OUM65202.1 hypothetical protein PIROE2DRAFT_41901 [Piromyces sp. E2]